MRRRPQRPIVAHGPSRIRRFMPLRTLLPVLFALLAAPASAEAPRPMPWGGAPPAAPAFARAAALTALGRVLFFDPGLSASGRMACATCHDPDHGFSPANDQAVQPGGPALDRFGTRAVPGLTYAQFSPGFTEHYFE